MLPPQLYAVESTFKQDSIYKRVYQNLVVSTVDPNDPSSSFDIYTADYAGGNFIRQLFNAQELTSDEAYCIWIDSGISDYDTNKIKTTNPLIDGLYRRIYKGIDLCNTFLENTASLTDSKTLQQRAEIRVMRALYFSYALDLFGNPPLTTSTTKVGEQVGRSALFDFIVKELKEAEPSVSDAHAYSSSDANYGLVNKGVVWMLLARLYLNAEVYTGTAHWADAATYAKKIIDSGAYQLYSTATNGWSAYQQLFMGDNGETGASHEMIMPIYLQGKTNGGYGTLFLIAATSFWNSTIVNPDKKTTGLGADAWGGVTSREPLIKRFFSDGTVPNAHACDMPTNAGDDRAIIEHPNGGYDYETSTFGAAPYMVKYNNFKTDGSAGSDNNFIDMDIPLMRYAEALLTYAEAEYRLGNTDEALKYVNEVRTRAHAKTLTTLSLNDLSDEWSREFFYEFRRRTDMVRFGTFTQTASRNVFPIPANIIEADPTLEQNEGYRATAPSADIKFSEATTALKDKVIEVENTPALPLFWNDIWTGDGEYTYTVSAGKNLKDSKTLLSTKNDSAKITTRALQKIIWDLYGEGTTTQTDLKLYVTGKWERYKQTDSLTLHIVPAATLPNENYLVDNNHNIINLSNSASGYAYLNGTVTAYLDTQVLTVKADEGFYQIQTDGKTLQLTKINIGMVGSFNNWGTFGDTPLTYNPSEKCWEGTLSSAEDVQLLFRANGNWNLMWRVDKKTDQLKGTLTESTGDNIEVPAGTYTVKVYITYPGDSHYEFITATGIKHITDESSVKSAHIYGVNGTRQPTLKKGVNIIRMSDGKTIKIIVR